jgi:hypothetical protein
MALSAYQLCPGDSIRERLHTTLENLFSIQVLRERSLTNIRKFANDHRNIYPKFIDKIRARLGAKSYKAELEYLYRATTMRDARHPPMPETEFRGKRALVLKMGCLVPSPLLTVE